MKGFHSVNQQAEETMNGLGDRSSPSSPRGGQFRVSPCFSTSDSANKMKFTSENDEKLVQLKKSQLLKMSVVIFLELKESSECKLCQSYVPLNHWHYFVDNDQQQWIESIPELVDPTKCCGNCRSSPEEDGSGKHFKLCGLCEKVYYCSKKCQVANWKLHSEICRKATIVSKIGDKDIPGCHLNGSPNRTPLSNSNNLNSNESRKNGQPMSNGSNSSGDYGNSNFNNGNVDLKQGPKNFIKGNNNFALKTLGDSTQQQQQTKKTIFKTEPTKKLPIIELNCGQKYQLMITFVDTNIDKSKVEFYATKQSYLGTILESTIKTVDKCALVKAQSIEINKVYYVKSEDGIWYRGQVLRDIEFKYYVKFIDFGNCEYIEKKSPINNFKSLAGTELDVDKVFPAAIRMIIRNIPNFQQHTFVSKHLQSAMDQTSQIKFNVDSFNQDLGSYSVSLE